MAKIILLEKTTTGNTSQAALPVYVLAAWQLSRAALWPFDNVKPSVLRKCKEFITGYLQSTSNTKAAFTGFCERVLLYTRLLEVSPNLPIEAPLMWLHPARKDGYAATQDLSRLMKAGRFVRASHLQGIATFIEGYQQYLEQPGPAALSKLHTRLFRLKQYNLMRLLSHIILQRSLSTKQVA